MYRFVCLLILFLLPGYSPARVGRSIDLSAAHSLIADSKLPGEILPTKYTIDIRPNLEESNFWGKIKIVLLWQEPTNKIVLHASNELEIADDDVKVLQYPSERSNKTADENDAKPVKIKRIDRMIKKPVMTIYLLETLKQGTVCELEIEFTGSIWENAAGLFRGSYSDNSGDKWEFLATHMRPNNARMLFPCFDEPAYKVPFSVSISREKNFVTLFNTKLKETVESHNQTVIDYFETTPPMSTFTFGFVTSQLTLIARTKTNSSICSKVDLRIWARDDIHFSLNDTYERVEKTLVFIQNYWNIDYPLEKLDIVILPGLTSIKPMDNWGLIVFKESEMLQSRYYLLAQEISYQWLGSWSTPYWWSDNHINKAIVGFLSIQASMQIDNGAEFDYEWPMTTLYSLYYEFSKRYPHSRITSMKQETISSKTELVLRMLNYTLGSETLKKGLQKFMVDREYKTFFADDVWEALTKQAHLDGKLCTKASIGDITNSWITKDRIPVITVDRNYAKKSAKITQQVFLRERPHDVPEQDKMLWWVPIVLVSQESLNFLNYVPIKWLKNEKEVNIEDFAKSDKFVIVNPEEIGPFPVNYDEKNWYMLSQYLQTKEGREIIPVHTRAKLLHDAWNLAYAGRLNFASAFNMTLFMKYERQHLVWQPFFTFIDHIGRHIDISKVHKNFEIYIRTLLAPLFEELGPENQEDEPPYKRNLRALSKTFLCRVGYAPCIQEAQSIYRKWMESSNPDELNLVPNQYLCPVFKWGNLEEWDFGLQRVISFPSNRRQSERTYLLKTLASCPSQPEKILKLLNITILEENGNFTENDVFLIFNMLSGNSAGYGNLFNFLKDNWDTIKLKFANKVNLWDSLISTSTGGFITQEGYDMVSQLYIQRQGEFASAEHIIEKSLKNIKEETKWSKENLPTIDKWLNDYLSANVDSNAKNK